MPRRAVAPLRRLARARLTRRGATLLVVGALLAVAGALLALPDVVALGAAALLAVAVAVGTLAARGLESGRGALTVDRRVQPHPVVRGQRGDTHLVVAARSASPAAYERLARLRLSEQAAHELVGPEGVRARVSARADRVEVRYGLHPRRRGRWTLGPLLTTRTDVFGLVRTTEPLGAATTVAVWPWTTELPLRSALLGDVEHAAAGSRLSSPDDSVVREYVAGDDPRRVHWPSAARRGRLMVRSDEAAGVRPVSVLLDRALLPAPGALRSVAGLTEHDGEWAVELTASVALAFLAAGHPVRLVGTATTPPAAVPFVTGTATGRGALLDATVDLTGTGNAEEARRGLVTTVRALRAIRTGGEALLAVLPALPPATTLDLAGLAGEGGCHALVVAAHAADGDETVTALRAAGWRAVAARPGEPAEQAWADLTEARR
ncbi:DUF58 domain-containing protein [Puerhibacterium puerhi]|uniref:DUF58 domain-containing protein n=1 Tax=Puerhibacterium puerhi TaxID=2692623 RepID=UPI00135CD95A|nr:DUF58 domain-containing protein [Puerhibacterium puerhi]